MYRVIADFGKSTKSFMYRKKSTDLIYSIHIRYDTIVHNLCRALIRRIPKGLL